VGENGDFQAVGLYLKYLVNGISGLLTIDGKSHMVNLMSLTHSNVTQSFF